MKSYDLKGKDVVKLHNILYSITSKVDYEMERLILLEGSYNDTFNYLLIEGSHCSCYDFDETTWYATELTQDELIKLLNNTQDYEILRIKLRNFLKYYDYDFERDLN